MKSYETKWNEAMTCRSKSIGWNDIGLLTRSFVGTDFD